MFDSDICTKKDGLPLKSYESEREAKEAVACVKRQYGNEQVFYKSNIVSIPWLLKMSKISSSKQHLGTGQKYECGLHPGFTQLLNQNTYFNKIPNDLCIHSEV